MNEILNNCSLTFMHKEVSYCIKTTHLPCSHPNHYSPPPPVPWCVSIVPEFPSLPVAHGGLFHIYHQLQSTFLIPPEQHQLGQYGTSSYKL